MNEQYLLYFLVIITLFMSIYVWEWIKWMGNTIWKIIKEILNAF